MASCPSPESFDQKGQYQATVLLFKLLYILLEETTEDLKAPLVVALCSGGFLPKDGDNVLKDPLDRK